jgi:hypothetical protein
MTMDILIVAMVLMNGRDVRRHGGGRSLGDHPSARTT